MRILKDKRGSAISITTLLVLVLVLGVATLGVLVRQNSRVAEELDLNSIQKIKVMEKQSEYLIKNVAESMAVESYAEIVDTKGYVWEDCEVKNGIVVFCSLNKEIDSKFKDVFKTKLVESFPDEFLVSRESLNVIVNSGKVDVKAFFEVSEFQKNSENYQKFSISEVSKIENLIVNYLWKEENSFSFNELGLDYFDEIYRGVEKCRDEESLAEGMKECLKLDNFEVVVSKTNDDFLVKLESKKKFVLGNEYKSLSFSFLI